MRAFVADASVAVGWVHPARATPEMAAMLDAIAEGARRRKLTQDERQTALGWLRVLPLRVDHEMSSLAFSRLSELATSHHLSVYDAAYLELAQRRKLMLSCTDGPLRNAALQSGVRIWESA